jgi:outer membrane lipoprotein
MRVTFRPVFRLLSTMALPIAIAACAPAPIYKTNASFATATPQQVATSPNNFSEMQTVWGGEVIGVNNFKDHTEIRILGYPLDGSQRPRLKEPATGRFIAVVPGFLDPMNYPDGSLMTVCVHIQGTQIYPVGSATYSYPMLFVRNGELHRWTPEEMRKGHPNISFGVGVGVGGRIR